MVAKGTKDLVQIATLFAAANAGTDVIKDVIYGRPIKRDELIEDNLWKLIGVNRYTVYNARRKGPGKAFIDFVAPPTAVFDCASMTYLPSLGTVSTRDQCYKALLSV